MPWMVAYVSLAEVCLAVKICRIMVKIIWACFLSICLVQVVSSTKVNLSQPLPLSLSATRVTTLWLKQFVFTVMSLFKYTKLPYICIRP